MISLRKMLQAQCRNSQVGFWTSVTLCDLAMTGVFSDLSNLFLQELKTLWHTQYARYTEPATGKLNFPIVSP